MSTEHRRPVAPYGQNLAHADTLLPSASKDLHHPLRDGRYTMDPVARVHEGESLLGFSQGIQNQNPNWVSTPMSSFANAPSPFQIDSRDSSGLNASMDSQMPLIPERHWPLGDQGEGSTSDSPVKRGSATPTTADKSSFGSFGVFDAENRNISLGTAGTSNSESFNAPEARASHDSSGGQGAVLQPSIANATTGNLEDDGSKVKHEDVDHPPSWTELKTKAGKERKRLPLACIACRRKKIRCSGEKPACKHCLRSRTPCVYKVTTRKAAPRTDYMAMLDKRLKRMEERVIKIIPKEELANTAFVARAVVRPTHNVQPKSTAGKKRAASEAFASELDVWANCKPQSSAENPLKAGRQTQDCSDKDILTEGAEDLPSKEIQLHLTGVFFDRLYGQIYHLLHKPSHMRRLHANTVPPVLTLAICAISARFSDHPYFSRNQEPTFLRGENWARAAREIALRKYDEPSITIITVYLILGLHDFGTCQGGRSWMFGGMAIRMAYALQLHHDLDRDPLGRKSGNEATRFSLTDREIRRRVMWACFLMDRFMSSGTERPTVINDHYVKVPLPIKEQYFQLDIPGPTPTLEEIGKCPGSPVSGNMADPQENMGVAAYNICVLALWGRVIQYLNLGGKERDAHPIWSPQSTFADLKAQLEAFKASLPGSLHNNASNLQSHATDKLANQFIFLHIAYHQVILLMNRFAIPSATGCRPSKDMPLDFLAQAKHAAIEASNKISALIELSSNYDVVAPYVGYCAFLSSTVHILGVFSNNVEVVESSKKNLALNVRYLSQMKKYWGMFHFMAESLSDIYRQHADAASKGLNAAGARSQPSTIFQYGDWFDRYPRGISSVNLQDTSAGIKQEDGNEAVLSQKSNLQSIEEYFQTLSPASKAKQSKKATKKESGSNAAGSIKHSTASQLSTMGLRQAGEGAGPAQTSRSNAPFPQGTTFDASQRPNGFQKHQQLLQGYHQPQYQTDLSYLAAQPQGILQDLDRQLGYDAYAGMGPMSAASSSQIADSNTMTDSMADNDNNGSMWNQMDMGNLAPGGLMNDATSAWFMPFNIQPPEIFDDASVMFGGGLAGSSFPMLPAQPRQD